MPTTLAELNSGSRAAFTSALGHLFEHSPWVAAETWERRPFRDPEHLHSELCATMRKADPDRQISLIRAHPDLAGRLALAGQLTPESTREQASAGLQNLEGAELAAFQKANAAYRAKFGFPFIICARLSNRAQILKALQARTENTLVQEHAAALAEIEKIAWLRLRDALGLH